MTSGRYRPGVGLAMLWLAIEATPARADVTPRRMGDEVEVPGSAPPVRVRLKAAGPGERLSARTVQVGEHRVIDLRAMNAAGDRGSAWIGQWGATGPRLIWTGAVGAMDADAENWLDLHVTPNGIEEFQGASRLVGCDQKALRLFPRRWDFARQAFLPAAPEPKAVPTPRIAARRSDRETATSHHRFRVVGVSSVWGGERKASALIVPQSLDDDDPKTGWRSADGPGRGESIVLRSGTGIETVTGVRLLPGLTGSLAAFKSTPSPRSLTLILGPGGDQKFEVDLINDQPTIDLASARQPFFIPLPRPVATSCVQIVVEGGAEGVALSGLSVVTATAPTSEILARLSRDDHPDCAAAGRHLAADATGPSQKLREAIEAAPAGTRHCLLTAFAGALADPAFAKAERAEASRAALASVRGASREEETALRQILARIQPAPTVPLRALVVDPNATSDDQTRAVRILAGLIGPEAEAVLGGLIGTGSAGVRQELRGWAAGRPAPWLAATFAETSTDQVLRRADLALALGVAAKREKTISLAPDLARAARNPREAFSVRARAIEAVGRIGAPESLPLLVAVRTTDADPVLREFAVRGLAGQEAATSALREALNDADPRVREAAVNELGLRRDPSARELLIAGAKQEPWPRVRRAQIMALGRICGDGVGALLSRAVERDGDEIRRAALAGFVSCRDPEARSRLLRVAGRARESAAMRGRAVALLGDLDDKGAGPELGAAIERMLVESQADLALEPVLGDAMRVLGRLSKRDAKKAAGALLRDQRPALRRTAIEALDTACDTEGRAAISDMLTAATKDADENVADLARAAVSRCQSR